MKINEQLLWNNDYDVVVIDSGYNPSSIDLPIDGICLKQDASGKTIVEKDFFDKLGHGTVVVNIIRKFNPKINVFIIKIFDDKLVTTEDLLIAALKYVYLHLKTKIINLSSTVTFGSKLNEVYDLCEAIKNKGIILIAAISNYSKLSYPAIFKNVIGVSTQDKKSIKNKLVVFVESNIVEVIGINFKIKVEVSKKTIEISGSSYLTAYMSGLIVNMLPNNDIDKVKAHLRSIHYIKIE